jgi:hypothetical protein
VSPHLMGHRGDPFANYLFPKILGSAETRFNRDSFAPEHLAALHALGLHVLTTGSAPLCQADGLLDGKFSRTPPLTMRVHWGWAYWTTSAADVDAEDTPPKRAGLRRRCEFLYRALSGPAGGTNHTRILSPGRLVYLRRIFGAENV